MITAKSIYELVNKKPGRLVEDDAIDLFNKLLTKYELSKKVFFESGLEYKCVDCQEAEFIDTKLTRPRSFMMIDEPGKDVANNESIVKYIRMSLDEVIPGDL